jgi:hypothetical protein
MTIVIGVLWLVVLLLVVVVRACAEHGVYFLRRRRFVLGSGLLLRLELSLRLSLSLVRAVLQRGRLATGMLRVRVLPLYLGWLLRDLGGLRWI